MAIKKALQATVAYMGTQDTAVTVEALLLDPKFIKLVEAGKGGFNGEDSFVTVEGAKVGRVCAMTGGVFAHDNTDKSVSFFYKNGSYMIGAEVVKANARKEWELDREARELDLENQMLEGTIAPKEWKEQANLIKEESFDYEMPQATKDELIADFNGYESKEAFTEAYTNGAVAPFTDYEEEVKALRDLAPTRPTVEEEA